MSFKEVFEIIGKMFPNWANVDIHAMARKLVELNDTDGQKLKALIDLIAMSRI